MAKPNWVLNDSNFDTALTNEGITLYALASRIGSGIWRLRQILKHAMHPPKRYRDAMATALSTTHNTLFTDLND